ncbi:CLF1 Pre-mRNA-splicing factor CLF1 [Candida maltosa Xu316]
MEDPKDQIRSKEILDVAFDKSKTKFSTPRQTIQDIEELRSYQQTKRREFEQHIHKNRLNLGQWLRYARWEVENNHDFPRARSIFERALDVNIQHIPFWVQYIELELSHKNINHARNLLERAIKTLPKVSKLWFLYVLTEEMLKNYQMVRTIFERWLEWHPDASAWDAYINFEARYEETDNVRQIFKQYLSEFPSGETWCKWIEYELENNSKDVVAIRAVFESAVDTLISEERVEDDKFVEIIIQWTNWEVSQGETERAREIYKFLLGDKLKIPSHVKNTIHIAFNVFESSLSGKESNENSQITKKKRKYLRDINENPYNYESWWEYITILQTNALNTIELVSAFKKVTSTVPEDQDKTMNWRQYVMFWIRYALWEEIDNKHIDSARSIWNEALKKIPSQRFSFAKIWIGYAEFELRNNDATEGLSKFRKILGRAIGQTSTVAPKNKIFQYYIDFEKKLGDWNRVRLLFQKWLETAVSTSSPAEYIVKNYLEFESSIEEYDRCESILEIAKELSETEESSDSFDVYKLFTIAVDFYRDEMKYDKIRELYRNLLSKEPDVDNWISFALFESTIPSTEQLEDFLQGESEEFEVTVDEEQIGKTRNIFTEAETYFKNKNDHASRLAILEAWKEYEEINGTEESAAEIKNKFPTAVKKRRTVDGIDEEYMDYVFPETQEIKKPIGMSKFLANAKKWASQG